ncbi:feruloyl-CoA synthase, partial [Pseudomonas syringae pv. pisi str. 1704B]
KGSINQRAVLQWRADKVEALYRDQDPDKLSAAPKA